MLHNSLGGVSFQLGEHMRSVECYVQYLTLSQEVPDSVHGEAAADPEVLLRLGLSNAAIGEYPIAHQFLQQAINFYQEQHDTYHKALCLHHIGAVQGRLGNFEEGMAYLKQSLELRTQSQDKVGIADCLEEMGLLCYNIGDYPNARGRFEAAQRLLTETNDKASIATCTMHIGACYAALGQVKEAKQQLQTALMADVHSNWAGKVDCLQHLACVQTLLAEPAAIKSLTLALSHLRDKGNRVGEAAMLMQLAQASAKLNELPQALDHLEQCLELRKSLNDKKGQADALIKIVYIHSALRNLGRARDAYEECFAIRLDIKDEAGQVECLNSRGLLAVHEGRMNEGITLHLEALKRLRQGNDMKTCAEVLNNIGVCYSLSGDYGNSTAHLEEAQKLMEHLELDGNEAKVLINLASCACEQQDYNAAIDMYEKALLLCRSQVLGSDKAVCHMNIGTVSMHLKDFDRAKVCYESALSLLTGRGDKLQEARCYHNLGALMHAKSETRQAIGYFETALQLFRAAKDGRAAMNCLQCLKASHMRLGDAFQAAQMIHLMQQLFPEEEVRFLVKELGETLNDARQRGDKVAEGAAHIELADAQMDVDMVAATAHAQKALLIRKALKDQDGQAQAYVRLGNIKLMQGENHHALEAFKKAGVSLGEVWREGSRARVEIGADIALGLGSSYLGLERYEEAVHVLNRCIHLADELGDKHGAYECSNLIAMAYYRLGNVPKATEFLRQGLGGELVTEGDKPDRVAGTASLVSTLVRVAKHEDALRAVTMYENNLAVQLEQNDQGAQANSYWSLGCAYASIDQLQQAAENFTKCHNLRLLSGSREGLAVALLRKGCSNLTCANTRAAAEDLDTYLSMVQEATERNQGQRPAEFPIEDECDAAIALAKAYARLGDISQAVDVLKRGNSAAVNEGRPACEGRIVITFGEIYSGLWITKRALDHYERALNIFADLGDRDSEARCTLQLGRLNFYRGDTGTAIKCLEEALALAKKAGSGTTVAQCLEEIADVHFVQGAYEQAKAHFEEACRKCREQLDPMGEARGLCGLSRVNLQLGDTKLALEQVEEGLKIRQSLGDAKATSECLCLLGQVYMKMGSLGQAQHVVQQARQISAENSEVLDSGRAEVLLGRIMALSGDLNGALEQVQRARDILAETTLLAGTKIFLDPHALGEALSELGLLFSQASQGERAIDCLQQAEKIAFASDDVVGLAAHQCNLALLLAKHSPDDLQKANEKLRLSLEASKKLGMNAGVAECTLVAGQIACLDDNATTGMGKIKIAIDLFQDMGDNCNVARALCLAAKEAGMSPMGVVQLQEALQRYRQMPDKIGEAQALQQTAELESALGNADKSAKNWIDCLAVKRGIGDMKVSCWPHPSLLCLPRVRSFLCLPRLPLPASLRARLLLAPCCCLLSCVACSLPALPSLVRARRHGLCAYGTTRVTEHSTRLLKILYCREAKRVWRPWWWNTTSWVTTSSLSSMVLN
jgi:tetratricopeptide (TPR) repeat protein